MCPFLLSVTSPTSLWAFLPIILVHPLDNNNTGAGPPNTVGSGTCVFRTDDPTNPSTFRGWNGSSWSTSWINPYEHPATPPDQLWQHTCAAVDLGTTRTRNVAHLNPKKFAGSILKYPGWPTHVMTGLAGSETFYYFPNENASVDGPAPFTSWTPGPGVHAAGIVNVTAWMDPCTIGSGRLNWMYPNLIDHDSPFGLSHGDGNSVPESDILSDGLSYGLVGNRSLYLYAVLSRLYIIRIPVAFFLPHETPPTGPFSNPLPQPQRNSLECAQFHVSGAGISAVNGIYKLVSPGNPAKNIAPRYILNDAHQLYHFGGHWTLGRSGKDGIEYYTAMKDPSLHDYAGVPITSWSDRGNGCDGPGQPTVLCVK